MKLIWLVFYLAFVTLTAKADIVVLKEGVDARIFARSNNIEILDRLDIINGFSYKPTSEVNFSGNRGVLFTERESIFTIPKLKKKRPITIQVGQRTPWGITRTGGFDCQVTRCKRVWVIDTGVDYNHPDLRVLKRWAFSAFKGTANDNNGHGTHVAGTIAAINNLEGVVGVAAGARIIPVKVLDAQGYGSTSGVIKGIDWAAQNFKLGDVANISLGGDPSRALDLAVVNAAKKGLKFAIAAGNESQDSKWSSPARAEHENIYTISAVNSRDELASFSNYGSHVDKAEPGVRILSTVPGGKYQMYSGTSMAAPHAAGILLKGFGRVCKGIKKDKDRLQPECVGEVRKRFK